MQYTWTPPATLLILASFLAVAGGFSAVSARRGGRGNKGGPAKSRIPARDKEATVVAAPAGGPRYEQWQRQPLAAPWQKPLKKALEHGGTQRKRDRSEAKRKHVQIATVDPATGRPSVRTVVFRGFLPSKYTNDESSCCLMFITDDRSAKYRHLAGASSEGGMAPIEACWWLDEAGVQFRIAGQAVLATAQSDDEMLRAAVADVWDRLSPSSRRTFSWPCPGAPKGTDVPPATAGATERGRGDGDEAPPLEETHFALLLLVPETVDELHLGGRQRRVFYQREEAAAGDAVDAAALVRRALESTTSKTQWTETGVNP